MGFVPIYREGTGISISGNQISAVGAGGSDFVSYQAGVNLAVNLMVSLSNGQLFPSQLSDDPESVVGMVKVAALAGAQAQVIRSGRVPGFSLVADRDYYVAANGSISLTIPTSGLLMPVGKSISTTELSLALGVGILRS